MTVSHCKPELLEKFDGSEPVTDYLYINTHSYMLPVVSIQISTLKVLNAVYCFLIAASQMTTNSVASTASIYELTVL